MPEVRAGTRGVRVSADLDIHLAGDDAAGRVAHLGDDAGGLVLDIERPAAVHRAVPVRRLGVDVPDWLHRALSTQAPLRVTSAGRDIGRVELGAAGRIRVRPTPAGVRLAVGLVLTPRRRLLLAAAVIGAAVTAAAAVPVGRRLAAKRSSG